MVKKFCVLVCSMLILGSVPVLADVSISYGDAPPVSYDELVQDVNPVSNIDVPLNLTPVSPTVPESMYNSSESTVKFVFSNKLLKDYNSSQTVTIQTTGIPDGTMLPLSLNDNNGLWVPPAVKIINNTATFIMYSMSTHGDSSYQITTQFKGVNYSAQVAYGAPTTVNVGEQSTSDEYIIKTRVIGNIARNDSGNYANQYVTVVVDTQNIPDGTSLAPIVTGGLSVRDSVVQNNRAVYRVHSSASTIEGVCRMTLNFNNSKKYVDIQVGNGYGHSENEQNLTSIINSESFDRITQSNTLLALRASSCEVDILTKNIPNNTVLKPVIEGGLVLVSPNAIVKNNSAKVMIKNPGTVPAGDYRLRVSFGGSDAAAYIQVRTAGHAGSDGGYFNDTYYTNNSRNTVLTKNITGFYADTYSIENGKSVMFQLSTFGIPNGVYLKPVCDELLLVTNRIVVIDNKATFNVENANNVKPGDYLIKLSYDNQTAQVKVTVPGLESSKNTSDYNNIGDSSFLDAVCGLPLIYGANDEVSVLVRSSEPDGTRLDVKLPDGLTYFADSLKDGEAVIKIQNNGRVKAGTYKCSVSYRDHVPNKFFEFNIVIKSANSVSSSEVLGLTPYIIDISVSPSNIRQGVAQDITLNITTKDIPNGTILYPMVSGDFVWNPSKGCIVQNNKAIYTIKQKNVTPSRSYKISIPYTRFVTDVFINID